MSDYQAIYDAVRSRISGGNIGDAVKDVAWRQFDISHTVQMLSQEFSITAYEGRRPSVLFRPTLSADGSQWCALYGNDLQTGIAGFGDTPEKAMIAFDLAWLNDLTPDAARKKNSIQSAPREEYADNGPTDPWQTSGPNS